MNHMQRLGVKLNAYSDTMKGVSLF